MEGESMAVFFYGCVSLDGYLATSDHGLDWLYETGTTEETGYDEFYRCMDVMVMGRRTLRRSDVLAIQVRRTLLRRISFLLIVSLIVWAFLRLRAAPSTSCGLWGPIGISGWLEVPASCHRCLMRLWSTIWLFRSHLCYWGLGSLFTQAEAVRRFRLERVNQYGRFAELMRSKRL